MNRTLLSVLAGLGGMLGWGTSDFLASNASEKIGHSKTFLWSQIAGFIFILLLLLIIHPTFSFTSFLFLLTLVGGVIYAIGYLFFYKAFEIGNVSVVSAVSNLYVLFMIGVSYFVRGQKLTTIQIPALAILLIGVTLVSINLNELRRGKVSLLTGVKETIIAAIIFGIVYWPLNEFLVEQINWLIISLITKIMAILTVFIFIFLLKRETVRIPFSKKPLMTLLLLVGVLEAAAVLSVSFGQEFGDGIIVAPISSALTVVTVTLAVLFTKEKITKLQGVGILLVVLGIVLTAF